MNAIFTALSIKLPTWGFFFFLVKMPFLKPYGKDYLPDTTGRIVWFQYNVYKQQIVVSCYFETDVYLGWGGLWNSGEEFHLASNQRVYFTTWVKKLELESLRNVQTLFNMFCFIQEPLFPSVLQM